MAEKSEAFSLPEGRLINESLFVKDQFNETATPSYKVEIAFDTDSTLNELDERLAKAATDKWGDGAADDYWNGNILSPIIDGNVLAARRVEKGKAGDAYEGKLVVRAHTIFNKHGADEAGGIQVYAPDLTSIDVASRQEIYAGCFGCAGVKIGTYEDSRTGNHALMFYLSAFQKTKDGDRLVANVDHSTLFEAVERKPGTKRVRRSRASSGAVTPPAAVLDDEIPF